MKLTYPLAVATAAAVPTPGCVTTSTSTTTVSVTVYPSSSAPAAAASTPLGVSVVSPPCGAKSTVTVTGSPTSITVYSTASAPAAYSTPSQFSNSTASQSPNTTAAAASVPVQSYAAASSSKQSSAAASSVAAVSSASSIAASPSASSSAAATNATVSAGSLPVNSDYKADVLSTIESLAPTYSNKSMVWQNIGGFEAATVYQDLMDYVYWTGDESQKFYGDNLLEIVKSHDMLNGVGALDDYNDDQGWWVLAFLHAYRTYGDAQFLNQSITQFNQIVASSQLSSNNAGTTPKLGGVSRNTPVPASCDVAGAVYWRQTPDSSINAVSTGLIAQIGGILYGITKEESFRTAADLALDYERRVMMDNSTGIMNVDSITTSTCAKNGADLCYNTGIYIDACTRLYQATGESKYLDWAVQSATSAVSGVFGNSTSAPLVISQGDNSPDTFFSALTEFYVMIKSDNIQTDLQSKIKTFVKANADYALAHAKQGNGLYSEDWVDHTAGTAWGSGSTLSLLMAASLML